MKVAYSGKKEEIGPVRELLRSEKTVNRPVGRKGQDRQKRNRISVVVK